MKKQYVKLMVMMALFGFAAFGAVQSARADTVLGPAGCLNFSANMGIGTTSGNVVALQNFLNGNGYMSYTSTGYFGPITYAAVAKFQAAYGIPNTGFVGPLTRAEISVLSCGSVVPPPAPLPVTIFSVTPNYGPVGTTVTITGRGFTANNRVNFAGGAIGNIPSTDGVAIACTTDPTCVPGIRQTLTFTIPSSIGPYCAPGFMCAMYVRLVTPGAYDISVSNDNGTSNSMSYTVTDANTAPLSISGIDAPNSLPVGTPGTWTVHASSGATGTLHYSVNWGDQTSAASGIMAPAPSTTQSSATFTHSYQYTGTYNPTFTVSDDYGHSVTSSASVLVTPLY